MRYSETETTSDRMRDSQDGNTDRHVTVVSPRVPRGRPRPQAQAFRALLTDAERCSTAPPGGTYTLR